MSHFFRALQQAEQDRARRQNADSPRAEAPPSAPTAEGEPAAAPAAPEPGPVATEAPGAPPPVPPATEPPAVEARSGATASVDPHLVTLLAPNAPQADQYRVLAYTVDRLHRASGLVVVAVSSAAAGDGKTTTAINLAGALVHGDMRVLLVDCDLRRPEMAARLGLGPGARRGLTDALLDPAVDPSTLVVTRPPFRLSVMSAGRETSAPYELLKSPRFPAVLERLRPGWDVIILDVAPVVPFPDVRALMPSVDGLFLVVAAHRTPRRLVEESLGVVDPAKLLGVVFNRDDRPLSGYRDRAYPGDGDGRHRGWRGRVWPEVIARR